MDINVIAFYCNLCIYSYTSAVAISCLVFSGEGTLADVDFQIVMSRLKENDPRQAGDSPTVCCLMRQRTSLSVKEGVLYRSLPEHTQIVVPFACRADILKTMHAAPSAGHFGRDRTLQRMREAYYLPGMADDVSVLCGLYSA